MTNLEKLKRQRTLLIETNFNFTKQLIALKAIKKNTPNAQLIMTHQETMLQEKVCENSELIMKLNESICLLESREPKAGVYGSRQGK